MGRDVVSREVRLPQICFNPRSRMGSDNLLRPTDVGERQVSIHAPTWGATRCRAHRVCSIGSFNPRSHLGSDYVASNDSVGIDVSIHAPTWGATLRNIALVPCVAFQPTLPHGERPCNPPCPTRPCRCFNPRSRMGSDIRDDIPFQSLQVSTHAPAWGATRETIYTERVVQFQPTLPHGERRISQFCRLYFCCFNPRSRMGSDLDVFTEHT